jgi:cytochrome c biogenesis protein CcdA/thiol-disulfide isomerase/thioredoxin
MALILLAYLGGVLTIVSPCILPVLPFVFARTGRPFLRGTLPMLAGMAVTFALVATLAAVGGGWAVEANRYGRAAAMAILAVFGLILLFPALADRLTRPVVALGARLSNTADTAGGSIWGALLLGIATGLLWAPCAGPILGLILAGAALEGASLQSTGLLLAYALGAATSLALALLVGGRVYAAMKRSLGVGEWVRRGLGGLVLVAVVAIAMGVDTGFLARVSLQSTASLENGLMDRLRTQSGETAMSGAMTGGQGMMMSANPSMMMKADPKGAAGGGLPVEGRMPPLDGAVQWLNSEPLTAAGLKGKVVLVDFWTYSCINCLRAIPYIRAWAEKYGDEGLVVIGVHAPEFAFEKDIGNVKKAVADLDIHYPVAIDNNYAIWQAFHNQYWPAHYFIDAEGRIRHHHFGEGDYAESEKIIQELLAEAGNTPPEDGLVSVDAKGVEAPADLAGVGSPETYIGYDRAENFISPGGAVADMAHDYTVSRPALNEWGLTGTWTVGEERAILDMAGGGITFRFHARDLHLVLGPGSDGQPVPFTVTVDGQPPGADHGTDTDTGGKGTVTGERLYQLVRQKGEVMDHTFEIHFDTPGVAAYAFTFG